MIRSAYFCVTLHVRHRKLPFIAILTWFLILGKIQDGSQDNDHIILFCWRQKPPAAPPPIKYTSSCWEDQRFSTEGKIVSKYCNISKTLGRGSMYPPLLVPWRCYDFACTSEGQVVLSKGSAWFCMWLHFFIKASFIIDTKGFIVSRKAIFLFLPCCFVSGALLSFYEFYF